MYVFVYSTFHEIGRDFKEMFNSPGFTFETRDELDFKTLYAFEKFGFVVNPDLAKVIVMDTNQHASNALPLDDSHEYYRHLSKCREKLSYVRVMTGDGKLGFRGILGFTDYRTQSPQNVVMNSPGVSTGEPGNKYYQIRQLAESRYPGWKALT